MSEAREVTVGRGCMYVVGQPVTFVPPSPELRRVPPFWVERVEADRITFYLPGSWGER